MGLEDWLPLNRLKRAVKKVRFLLTFDLSRFRVASIMGRSNTQPRLSFNDRQSSFKDHKLSFKDQRLSFNDRPGLQAINDDADTGEAIGVSPIRALQRTMSSPMSQISSDEDIDRKAELFIQNFYSQLRMERQVSLKLRYCRSDSNGSDS
ncbi:hypothetical protein NE237_025075 [Protea cynaroides]|uniref:Uncharacterized protein n=1 Tax=Protea cynaroides TaxID=273540 RepID=A0A9Q0JZ59_9MAGN|nr:hypothetical protein NE237_025075 [Protea cynaroides]